MDSAAPTLDLDFVRAQFPAFAHPESADWAHFENAGGSYVPHHVISILQHFYTATKVQPYGPAGPAKAAGEAMDRGYALLPATLNCAADELSIGPSTTQNTFVAALAVRGMLNEGDQIVVTNQDHEANIGAWRRLADTGIDVVEWAVDPTTGLLDVADLEALICDRTRLVCVTHASNVAATINPVAEIAQLVHAAGALLAVDGVAFAPHGAVDVQALGCDMYFYSTYKTYGPHLGAMYVRAEVLDQITNQGHYFNGVYRNKRLTPAGPNHAEIAASAGIVDYYEDLYRHHQLGDHATLVERIAAVFDLFEHHETALMGPLMNYLGDADVSIIGDTSGDRSKRAPTISFAPDGVTPEAVVAHLANRGIGANHGDFYARRLIDAMGLAPQGVVRLSLVHYNTLDEVNRCIDALTEVL
jgi:cysteine desulfurase family protein (TIGR01976 family)